MNLQSTKKSGGKYEQKECGVWESRAFRNPRGSKETTPRSCYVPVAGLETESGGWVTQC
jgi:hypothetical protein